MKPESADPKKTERSPWWPLSIRWVQIAIIVAIIVYAINFVVAIVNPGS